MAKVPPRGKGEPPPPAETVGSLDRGEVSHLNFRAEGFPQGIQPIRHPARFQEPDGRAL
jgi:hypothetical protein